MSYGLDNSGGDFGDWRLLRLPGRPRASALLGGAVVTGAMWLFGPDTVLTVALFAVLLGAAAALLVGVAVVLIVIGVEHVLMIAMPYEIYVDARKTLRERREQWARARSMAGSPATDLAPPSASVSLRWGIFSLVFPVVGPVAIWYGRDALRFIRVSGGAMAGERKARLGLTLGAIGTLEMVLLLVLVATAPTK